ncbi:LOW QUALITY PROTEIN: hypothetical protein AAY473_030054 [Plecturocebus cupreus]
MSSCCSAAPLLHLSQWKKISLCWSLTVSPACAKLALLGMMPPSESFSPPSSGTLARRTSVMRPRASMTSWPEDGNPGPIEHSIITNWDDMEITPSTKSCMWSWRSTWCC